MAGPNGAGKSTLLAIMAGLIEPGHGSIERTPDARTAMLGHQSFLYPEMTAIENLKFWSRLHGLKLGEAELDKALARVHLDHVKYEQSATFSRGMTQRLSLARVFLLSPNIMLLDEPGTGLDTFSMDILYSEIEKAAKNGVAIVWISHNLKEDIKRSQKVIILDEQKLSFFGSAEKYFQENFASSQDMNKLSAKNSDSKKFTMDTEESYSPQNKALKEKQAPGVKDLNEVPQTNNKEPS